MCMQRKITHWNDTKQFLVFWHATTSLSIIVIVDQCHKQCFAPSGANWRKNDWCNITFSHMTISWLLVLPPVSINAKETKQLNTLSNHNRTYRWHSPRLQSSSALAMAQLRYANDIVLFSGHMQKATAKSIIHFRRISRNCYWSLVKWWEYALYITRKKYRTQYNKTWEECL